MSRWTRYFSTPEDTARTLERDGLANVFDICDFETCPSRSEECEKAGSICPLDTYEGILEWLEGEEA